MNLWLLKNENALPNKLERYPKAAEQVGFSVETVDIQDITLLTAQNNEFSLLKKGKKLHQKDYPDVVLVICRTFGTTHFDYWSAEVVQHLEISGAIMANPVAGIVLADNKWLTHQKLVAHAIETPTTSLFSRKVNQNEMLSTLSYPIILKTAFGSKGEGVFLCEDTEAIVNNIAAIDEYKTVIIQEYLPETHGRDVRAFVVGDRVVAAMLRTAATDNFKANLGADGSGTIFKLTEEQEKMAVDATQALGLLYSGVDLLFKSDDELVVGEVNANPGLGIEEVTGINVSLEVCRYLQKLVESKRK